MTTKEIIERLQELDPTGEKEPVFSFKHQFDYFDLTPVDIFLYESNRPGEKDLIVGLETYQEPDSDSKKE